MATAMADRLVIYVLENDGTRVGLLDEWSSFEAHARMTDVGSWLLEMPTLGQGGTLLIPGRRVAFVLDDEVFLSGPITALEESGDKLKASGPDDLALLQWALAYPQAPGLDPNNVDADVRTGAAEAMAAGYVRDNIGQTADAGRRTVRVVESTPSLGSVLNESARFEPIVEVVKRIIAFDGLGQRCRWDGTSGLPVWEVFAPRDQRGTVQFSAVRDTLVSYTARQAMPTATRAIIGGSGDGAARIFREVVNPDTEAQWGVRIETFIDARDTSDTNTLDVRGFQATPFAPATIDASTIDTHGTQYGRDWRLGDRVQAIAGTMTTDLLITEVVVSGAPLRVAPVLGSYDAIRWEALAAVRQKALQRRVDALEARK